MMYYLYGFVRLWVPEGIWLSLNSIFLFYLIIFKLVTKELSSQSYVIYTGCVYRTSHEVSNEFEIVALLLLYCVISNHLVMGSFFVTALILEDISLSYIIYRVL